jgi:hypothetical protein
MPPEWHDRLRQCWRLARGAFRCPVMHQTPLPVHPALLGNNEHRLPGFAHDFILRFNRELREGRCRGRCRGPSMRRRDGIGAWHDPPCGTAP